MENNTYINILISSLEQKIQLLNQIIEITTVQSNILNNPSKEPEEMEKTFAQKEQIIAQIDSLDSGFQSIFSRVKEEIGQNKDQYKEEILLMQDKIAKLTDISVEIQALEERNKSKMQVYFSTQQTKIKEYRTTNKTAASYYKNMANQHHGESVFFDKKK